MRLARRLRVLDDSPRRRLERTLHRALVARVRVSTRDRDVGHARALMSGSRRGEDRRDNRCRVFVTTRHPGGGEFPRGPRGDFSGSHQNSGRCSIGTPRDMVGRGGRRARVGARARARARRWDARERHRGRLRRARGQVPRVRRGRRDAVARHGRHAPERPRRKRLRTPREDRGVGQGPSRGARTASPRFDRPFFCGDELAQKPATNRRAETSL